MSYISDLRDGRLGRLSCTMLRCGRRCGRMAGHGDEIGQLRTAEGWAHEKLSTDESEGRAWMVHEGQVSIIQGAGLQQGT